MINGGTVLKEHHPSSILVATVGGKLKGKKHRANKKSVIIDSRCQTTLDTPYIT